MSWTSSRRAAPTSSSSRSRRGAPIGSGIRSRRSTPASGLGSGGSPARGSRAHPEAARGRRLRLDADRDHRRGPRHARSSSTSRTCSEPRAHVDRRAHRPRRATSSRSRPTCRNRPRASRSSGCPTRRSARRVQRVHNACANSGLPLPRRRLTVNLSPASLPKHGIGLRRRDRHRRARDGAARGRRARSRRPCTSASWGWTDDCVPCPGVLPAVVAAARAGFRRVVVPAACRAEAELVEGVEVLRGREPARMSRAGTASTWPRSPQDAGPCSARRHPTDDRAAPDLVDVVGQHEAVEALIVGGGRRTPSADVRAARRRQDDARPSSSRASCRDLDDEAALQVASIRSLAGLPVRDLSRAPPFEAPHHSASVAALVGGGSRDGAPRARSRARATACSSSTRRGSTADTRSTRCVSRSRRADRDPPRRLPGLLPRALPARARHEPVPVRPVRRARRRVRVSVDRDPPLPRATLRAAARPHRHRAGCPAGVAGAAAGPAASTTTTAEARARVHDARARARRRLRDTPVAHERRRPGHAGCAQDRSHPRRSSAGPSTPRCIAGRSRLRGYDRVLRVAWTLADLAGRDRLDVADIGRALFLKKGTSRMTLDLSSPAARVPRSATTPTRLGDDDDRRRLDARALWSASDRTG